MEKTGESGGGGGEDERRGGGKSRGWALGGGSQPSSE